MARQGFTTEKWLELVAENGARGEGIKLIRVSSAPGGDFGPEDEAGIGSLALNTSDGTVYTKIANAGNAADWKSISDSVNLDELSWRNETVQAATIDTLAPGAGIDPTAFSDNESGVDATNWNVGDHILGDVDGTPALFEITAKASATSITLAAASQPLADNDTFVVQSYLPDSPAGNELQAIVHFPSASGPGVKIADVNW